MSRRAKKEYLQSIRDKYLVSGKEEKEKILHEFCKICNYNRKYAIFLLNQKGKDIKKKNLKRTGRPRYYSDQRLYPKVRFNYDTTRPFLSLQA